LLCEFAISDVLACAEQFVGAPGGISFDSSKDLKKSHVAVGANDTMFVLQVASATNDFVYCSGGKLPILRVNHFEDHAQVNGAFDRRYPPDTAKFGGPSDLILDRVKFVMPYVSHSLSFFKPRIALL
jgi:hypothetical protein